MSSGESRTGHRPPPPPLELLRAALAAAPSRRLLAWEEGEWTVEQLGARAAELAAAIAAQGVPAGARIALMLSNRPDFFAAQYGTWMLGSVEVAVNPDLRGPTLAHVLTDSDPSIVIADPSLLEPIATACPGLAKRMPVLAVDDRRLTGPALAPAEWARPAADELASILYTSGTTGPSKGVMLPHGYFSNHASILAETQELGAADVLYSPLALCHVDQHIYLPTCLLTGASLAFRSRFSASRFWEDVERFGATWLAAVGWILAAVASHGPPRRQQAAKLRRALAAPITPDLYRFYADELGIRLESMFGQTEADGVAFTSRRRERGSAGTPHPCFEVRIAGPGGEPLPAGTTGEILYRPRRPNLMMIGYWRRPEATADAWRDLWFHTGDYGMLDEHGCLWFRGRMTDSLRRRGENISAFELESTVKAFSGIRDCAAIAVPDRAGGEDEIKLIVILEAGAELDPAGFASRCEEELPRFARPRFLETVAEDGIPRGPGTGAIQKHRLSVATEGDAVLDLASAERRGPGLPG